MLYEWIMTDLTTDPKSSKDPRGAFILNSKIRPIQILLILILMTQEDFKV